MQKYEIIYLFVKEHPSLVKNDFIDCGKDFRNPCYANFVNTIANLGAIHDGSVITLKQTSGVSEVVKEQEQNMFRSMIMFNVEQNAWP